MTISNCARVIFPESGHTKGDLADYYEQISPLILPFLANRPTSLVRCPKGIAGTCFFQKHYTHSLGSLVRHLAIREKDGAVEEYIFLNDADGLLACVQMSTVEFHIWGAHCSDPESPDRLVFDLDPGDGVEFADIKWAAKEIAKRLSYSELKSFALLTGGKGIHVVVPLSGGHGWDAHSGFAHCFARALAVEEKDRFTDQMSRENRKGKIFIDYLRNHRGNTAVAPYSARAHAGASVAIPVGWEELDEFDSARPYSIGDAALLLKRAESSFLADWGIADQTLPLE